MQKIISFYISFLICLSIYSQTENEKYADDVKTIDAIINAYYDVVSGSADDPWQFERDKYIHSKNPVITRIQENGKVSSHSLEAEYIPLALAQKEDFYEKELKRTISRFGNMAQVWSAFEIRTEPDTPSNIRGLNSIQLHFENGRWWIDGWTCEMELENNTLVADFLSKD